MIVIIALGIILAVVVMKLAPKVARKSLNIADDFLDHLWIGKKPTKKG